MNPFETLKDVQDAYRTYVYTFQKIRNSGNTPIFNLIVVSNVAKAFKNSQKKAYSTKRFWKSLLERTKRENSQTLPSYPINIKARLFSQYYETTQTL
jgi:hypothetical protein